MVNSVRSASFREERKSETIVELREQLQATEVNLHDQIVLGEACEQQLCTANSQNAALEVSEGWECMGWNPPYN